MMIQKGKHKVLFVCLGNICRSPTAEAIFKSMVKDRKIEKDFIVDSAGLISYHQGEKADPRMRTHAIRRGYQLDSLSRPIQTDDFFYFDWIIAMDGRNFDRLKQLVPDVESMGKIHQMMDFSSQNNYDYVPDPYYSGAEGFELVLDLLEDACEGLLNVISSDQDI